jgi:hypothetical protein
MNRNFVCLLVLLSGLIGCDTNEKPVFPVYPVKGTVKYDDGKPLTDCWIEFTSQAGETKGRNSNSKIDKDGNFEMETFARGKGAYAGPVTAVISEPAPKSESETEEVKILHDKVLEKYKNYETSGLKFDIEKKDNTLNIIIDRK